MFLETPTKGCHKAGWIEVITGSMFSGKTEELIRRLKRAQIAKQKVAIFKPELDKRYSEKEIVSHDQSSIPSIPIKHPAQILEHSNEAEVIGIDEAQFFDDSIIEICNDLANKGKRVIIAGLDMDYQGKPFGPMPALMAIAEYVTKVHAICIKCGNLAHFSHRITASNSLIELGEKDKYEPLCRACYLEAIKKEK